MKRSVRATGFAVASLAVLVGVSACSLDFGTAKTSTSATPTKSTATPTSTAAPANPALPAAALPTGQGEKNQKVENFEFSEGWATDGNLFYKTDNSDKGKGDFFVPGYGLVELNASPLFEDEKVKSLRVWPMVRDNRVLGVAYLETAAPGASESTTRSRNNSEESPAPVAKNKGELVIFDPGVKNEDEKRDASIISRKPLAIELPDPEFDSFGEKFEPTSSLNISTIFSAVDGQVLLQNRTAATTFSINVDSAAITWQKTGTVLGREGKTLVFLEPSTDQTCASVTGVNAADGKTIFSHVGVRWGLADTCESVSGSFMRTTGTWNETRFAGGPLVEVKTNGLVPESHYYRLADGAEIKGTTVVPWANYDPYSAMAVHDGQSTPQPLAMAVFAVGNQKDVYGIPFENARKFGVESLTLFDGLWFLQTNRGAPIVDLKNGGFAAANGPGNREARFPVAQVGDVTCLNTGTCFVNFDVRQWIKDEASNTEPNDAKYLNDPLNGEGSREDSGEKSGDVTNQRSNGNSNQNSNESSNGNSDENSNESSNDNSDQNSDDNSNESSSDETTSSQRNRN